MSRSCSSCLCAIRAWCAEHGIEVVIPSKRNRKLPIPHDRARYRARHRIENLFCRAKDCTRIVLRKDKTSRSYAGFVSLAFVTIVFVYPPRHKEAQAALLAARMKFPDIPRAELSVEESDSDGSDGT